MQSRGHFGFGAIVAIALGGSLSASASAGEPIAGTAVAYELGKPVGDIKPANGGPTAPAPMRINPLAGEPDHGARGTWTRTRPPLDPLASHAQNPAGRTP